MTSGSRPDTSATPQPMQLAAWETMPEVGRMEGDVAEASPEVIAVEQGSASAPLAPSTTGETIPAVASWPEGLTTPGVGGESSWDLALASGDSQTWGEPPLRWMD